MEPLNKTLCIFFFRFHSYHRGWHTCLCCTRATERVPLWLKGKQSVRIILMLINWGSQKLSWYHSMHPLYCLYCTFFRYFSNKQQLCFCWSPSLTCTASGCWLSSYFNLLEQRWSGPVPWRTSEREISQTCSARGGRSSPNTSWSWPVQSQAFGQPPVSFYRATSSTARTLYVVTIYKYILYRAHMTTEGTLWRVS